MTLDAAERRRASINLTAKRERKRVSRQREKVIPDERTGCTNRSTQAESQWIVGQSLLSALTIPGGI